MSNKKLNSIEWLFDQMSNYAAGAVTELNPQEMLEKAKAMHREEITDSYTEGFVGKFVTFEEYYNQQFGDKK